jgi:hypothetical protein
VWIDATLSGQLRIGDVTTRVVAPKCAERVPAGQLLDVRQQVIRCVFH